jgi:hypothetical protein
MSKTSTYNVWQGMIARCRNKRNHRYGGRGISVSHEWERFENFYRDMGDKPFNKSLDRMDNNIGYSKENCRWATSREQSNNTSRNIILTHNGVSQTIAQWALQLSVKYDSLRARVRYGWGVEDILTKPFIKYAMRRRNG